MQQWHTHTGMCLAQGAFSAFIFLASHARRHICVYCRGWEFSPGANYWLFHLHKGASVRATLHPASESLSHSPQLDASCLGWRWGHRWCHLRHALPATEAPQQLLLPLRRSFTGQGSQNLSVVAWGSPFAHWTAAPGTYPRADGLADHRGGLSSPEHGPVFQVWEQKSFGSLQKNRSNLMLRFHVTYTTACCRHSKYLLSHETHPSAGGRLFSAGFSSGST